MSRLSPENVFLGLLEAQSCHGYQLLEHFRRPDALGHVWNLSTSQLYSLLKRLEHAELIDGHEEESADAPMRTVYWLTESGRHQFNNWMHTSTPSASTRAIRTEFLSRLYLAHLLNYPVAPLIAAQTVACAAHRDNLLRQCSTLAIGAGYFALDLRVQEMNIIVEWLAGVSKKLTSQETP